MCQRGHTRGDSRMWPGLSEPPLRRGIEQWIASPATSPLLSRQRASLYNRALATKPTPNTAPSGSGHTPYMIHHPHSHKTNWQMRQWSTAPNLARKPPWCNRPTVRNATRTPKNLYNTKTIDRRHPRDLHTDLGGYPDLVRASISFLL